MLETYQKKIIELLHRQELLLATYYGRLAGRFPEHGRFWMKMAAEEKQHAEWVKKLYLAEKQGLVIFDEGMVKTYTLNSFIAYLEKLIVEVEHRDLTPKQAAVYTLDLERSLIENKFFRQFETLDDSLKGLMTRLESETRAHLRKAEEFLAAMKQGAVGAG